MSPAHAGHEGRVAPEARGRKGVPRGGFRSAGSRRGWQVRARSRRQREDRFVTARWIRSPLAGLAATAMLMLGACGHGSPTASPQLTTSSSGVTGTVTVFAASSLTGTFTQLGKDFE